MVATGAAWGASGLGCMSPEALSAPAMAPVTAAIAIEAMIMFPRLLRADMKGGLAVAVSLAPIADVEGASPHGAVAFPSKCLVIPKPLFPRTAIRNHCWVTIPFMNE